MSYLLPLTLSTLGGLSLLVLSSTAPTLTTHQLSLLLVGLVLFGLSSQVKKTFYLKHALLIYLAVTFLLLVTLVLGGGRGTRRWLSLAGLSFQASQLAVPMVGLWLSLLTSQFDLRKLKELSILVSFILLPAGLIFLEPDLGATLWFLFPAAGLIFVSGTPLKHLFLLSGVGLLSSLVVFSLALKPYQKERIKSFLTANKTNSSQTASDYNRNQALIAIGSAGLWGRGFGGGTQSQLKFLPEKHTDFIFASATEEGGVIFALILISLYLLIFSFLLSQAKKASQPTNFFLFYLAVLFGWQVIINLGGNLGLLPITGLPLPFFSYGGSSIVSWALSLGITQSLVRPST